MEGLRLFLRRFIHLSWLLRPLACLFFISWTFNPYVALSSHGVVRGPLLFLVGCFVGIIFFYKDIYYHYRQLKRALLFNQDEDGYFLGYTLDLSEKLQKKGVLND